LGPVTDWPDGASPSNVYGMAGSVWEWVADQYDADYYANSSVENPFNISELLGQDRVFRGGGYDSPPEALRVTARMHESPTLYQNIPAVGFRCAQSIASE
jgi:formylglycine-generating enzyme required for sulfatase activity